MTTLSVNLNKVATLRNTRAIGIPSVIHCARLCIGAGAQGITLHPRPDERHIRPGDVKEVADLLRGHPGVELNIEGNPFLGVMDFAEKYRPAQCTLVPDDPEQATSDHGWDLAKDGARLRPVLARLRELGCRSSLFMDADPRPMQAAKDLGADRVELYTEPYAAAYARSDFAATLTSFSDAAREAARLDLGVNAGHDLNRDNLPAFLKAIPDTLEVSIGHALIADALELGLPETVRRYLAITSTSGARGRGR